MNQHFMNKLDTLRDVAGMPIIINSAYRSEGWEKSKNRNGKGDHSQGRGVDIRCHTSTDRYRILQAAIQVGFTRIGIAKTFIHVGEGENLPREVIWMY
ncbi:D-Ala-D-Ala carboxypeptidase family metallohydrolase [Bacteroides sp. 224]|uniref:D-Ala-D-Ala carboxypeptidase family metallohydrolase n=1 Tax=Bacteroides sp. 224 TaxID=2302936 RepID=UPI00351AC77A